MAGKQSDDLVIFLERLIDEKVILPETADLLKMLHDRDQTRNIQRAEIALLDGLGKGRKPRLKKDIPRDPELEGSYRVDLKDKIAGTQTGMKLQPNFVAWMMGYPQAWATLPSPSQPTAKNSSKLTATPSSQKSQSK